MDMLRSIVNSLGNPWSWSRRRKEGYGGKDCNVHRRLETFKWCVVRSVCKSSSVGTSLVILRTGLVLYVCSMGSHKPVSWWMWQISSILTLFLICSLPMVRTCHVPLIGFVTYCHLAQSVVALQMFVRHTFSSTAELEVVTLWGGQVRR